jgi:hypothetical protein
MTEDTMTADPTPTCDDIAAAFEDCGALAAAFETCGDLAAYEPTTTEEDD